MKKQMKKKKKLLWCVLAVLLVAIITVVVAGSNYLVNFAIARKDGVHNVAPTSIVDSDEMQRINQNILELQEKRDAWVQTVEIQTVELTSQDGLNLKADLFALNPESHKWMIGIHGYTSNRTHMQNFAYYYAKEGFNILLPDMRGHGESEGQFIGMGWPDRLDVLGWIDYVIQKDPEAEIVLHGISMGGATVMMVSGETLPVQVKAIVEDCGYTSVWDIFSDELSYLFHLPDFPLLYAADALAKLRAGYGFKEASALNQVANCQVPMFFIHGSEDNFVHTEMVYQLYDICNAPKELMIVEGAGHGNSYLLDPEQYFEKVFEFLQQYLTV